MTYSNFTQLDLTTNVQHTPIHRNELCPPVDTQWHTYAISVLRILPTVPQHLSTVFIRHFIFRISHSAVCILSTVVRLVVVTEKICDAASGASPHQLSFFGIKFQADIHWLIAVMHYSRALTDEIMSKL